MGHRTVAAMDRMTELIQEFPGQCKDALDLGKKASIRHAVKGISHIVCAGVGGSAIGADIVRSYTFKEVSLPFIVHRSYGLPAFVSGSSLVFVSSYSGNAEEAVSAYKEGMKRGSRLVAITSGGALAEMAESDKTDIVRLPGGLPPRCAIGYAFIPLLVLLAKAGFIKDKVIAIAAMIEDLETMAVEMAPDVPLERNRAKELAHRMTGKVPVFYGSCEHMDAVVTRWRSQFAENSKQLSSSHTFPEMSHNEIDGWQYPAFLAKHFISVFLRDREDNPRIARKMDISLKILADNGFEVLEVMSSGVELLSRMMSLVYLADMTSLYLARLNGVDPLAIDRIEYLKKEMGKEPLL